MSDVMPDYPDIVAAIIIIDCEDPQKLADFWGTLLGRKISNDQPDFKGLEWAPRFGCGLGFQRVPEPKVGKNRVHFDMLCQDMAAQVKRVEELGGKRAEGYPDTPQFIVMLDPEGNEFCLSPSPGG
jgi:predicted enzyme related to lactoylglutathione lyase